MPQVDEDYEERSEAKEEQQMIHEAMADCEQLSFEEAEIQAEQEANQTLLEEEQDNLVAEVAQEEVRIDENESQVSQE